MPSSPVSDLPSTFARWGVPEHPAELKPRAAEFLRAQLGVPAPSPATALDDIDVPASRLSADQRAALASAIGEDHVSIDRADRLAHAGGMSYVDLLRRRGGDVSGLVDAVAHPGSHDDVVALLAACEAQDIAVVPFGGGTSVVGGVTPAEEDRLSIAVAFDRMADVIEVDIDSCLVRVGPGITGPTLERLLAARGLTLGHLPQSWERASIGGYAATRSAGQASTGYGRSDEMIEALRIATPRGALDLGRGPATAAGPDLRQLVIGSEGAFGIITEVELRVRRLPTATRYEGLMFPSYDHGLAAFRELAQSRVTADVMRLSDEPETTATLSMSGPSGVAGRAFDGYLRTRGVAGGALAILGWEGLSDQVIGARRSAAWRILRRHGAVSLGAKVGESWRSGRFSGPYLRDTLMDSGYLVETLETATTWSRLPQLHESVLAELRERIPGCYAMSHVSHVYETGASLYVTVIAAKDASDPADQWWTAKRAVSDTLMRQGATITHHHAVGRDHAPWLALEIGDTGIAVLRAIKAHLDPRGIMNPGVLGL